jgi:Fur family zinc uptake transcriptional regulator
MTTAIEKRVKRAEKLCADNGGQLTTIRKTLLSIIYQHNGNLTAYELLHLFRGTNPKAESMTVYRALDFLQKQHLIHRLASKSTYAACDIPHEHHHAHFLLCEKCGHSEEVRSVPLEKAAKNLAAEYHFELSAKPIEIMGTCKACSHSAS